MLSRYRAAARVWSDPVGRVLYRLHLRPNHMTLIGLGVSLLAAAAFLTGHVRTGGVLVALAGLCDFCDGALARVSGQVTPFGAFLDSVIDRYSDLVVLLGIVVLFARTPHTRGVVVAMAALVGSVMVSYTKARAQSIGVECSVGFMERAERMICLVAGALLDLLEPALWVLAVLANLTAVQRIAFARRAMRAEPLLRAAVLGALLLAPVPAAAEWTLPPATERAWARAVESYQRGEPAPLLAELGTEAALASPIGDHVRWLLADAHARQGEWTAARDMAVALADRHRDSRLAPPALVLASTMAARAGDEPTAQALLMRLVAGYPDAAEIPAALYLLGMSAQARGQTEAAVAAYRELTLAAPASGYAAAAADRLAALARGGAPVAPLSLQQRVERAERLLRGGVPQAAADEADRIAADTRDPGLVVRALEVMARASQRLGRHDTAAKALEMAVRLAPADRRPALQLEQARAMSRGAQKERALPVLAAVAAHGGDGDAADALALSARLLEDLRREGDAEETYRTLAARFPAREAAGHALWRLGWVAHHRGDWRAAEQSWARLAEIPGGRSQRLAALYWTGRVRERLGQRAAAERAWQRVLADAPRSYYGLLASRRTAAPAIKASAEPVIRLPASPAEAAIADPGFVRVDLLRRLGLLEAALAELEEVVQRSVGDTVRLYAATGAYVRDERYHMALRVLRRHFTAVASSGHPDVPRAFWEMLYPLPWRGEVTEAAERSGLDPFLVAAIVREESSYYPRAVSRSGARGLMQLMPATAQPMADVRGWAFRGGELLDDPAANIQLGTAFMAGLLREFGDPRLALAAYNAGPRRLRDWWRARRGDDIEAFVEEIPFDETRHYVKRVMLSWDEYRRIYGPAAP